MPDAASTAAADQVRSDASLASSDFARLAAVTSPAQYQQVVASTGLESLLGRFDNDYRALGNTLGAQLTPPAAHLRSRQAGVRAPHP